MVPGVDPEVHVAGAPSLEPVQDSYDAPPCETHVQPEGQLLSDEHEITFGTQLEVESVVVVQPASAGTEGTTPPSSGPGVAGGTLPPWPLPPLKAAPPALPALELVATALPGQETWLSGVHVKLSPQSEFVWHGKL